MKPRGGNFDRAPNAPTRSRNRRKTLRVGRLRKRALITVIQRGHEFEDPAPSFRARLERRTRQSRSRPAQALLPEREQASSTTHRSRLEPVDCHVSIGRACRRARRTCYGCGGRRRLRDNRGRVWLRLHVRSRRTPTVAIPCLVGTAHRQYLSMSGGSPSMGTAAQRLRTILDEAAL